MCGIAGILLKREGVEIDTGRALIDMLDGCQHRGPDSTGFALYGDESQGQLKLRFYVGTDNEAGNAIARLKEVFAEHGAEIVEDEMIGGSYRVIVRFDGDLQKFSYAVEHAAKVLSIGESLEIVKDIGSALGVVVRFYQSQGTALEETRVGNMAQTLARIPAHRHAAQHDANQQRAYYDNRSFALCS